MLGAMAVATREVPDNTVSVGIPAKPKTQKKPNIETNKNI